MHVPGPSQTQAVGVRNVCWVGRGVLEALRGNSLCDELRVPSPGFVSAGLSVCGLLRRSYGCDHMCMTYSRHLAPTQLFCAALCVSHVRVRNPTFELCPSTCLLCCRSAWACIQVRDVVELRCIGCGACTHRLGQPVQCFAMSGAWWPRFQLRVSQCVPLPPLLAGL